MDELSAIEAAWARVTSEWQDPASHRRFLALCQSVGRLDEAGRRYREVRDGGDERRDEAERRIAEVLALAMQGLSGLKAEPPPKRPVWLFLLAAGVSGAIVVTSLWMLLRGA